MNTDAEIIAAELAETCEHGTRINETECTKCEDIPEGVALDEKGRLVIAPSYWESPSYLKYCKKNGLKPGKPSL